MARCLQLHISLRHTPVWRRLVIERDTATLEDLHEMIQAAFGWNGSHLYQFTAGNRQVAQSPYAERFGDDPPPGDEVPLTAALTKKGSRCEYIYDLGDWWVHDVRVEATVVGGGEGDEWLLSGEMAGPIDDMGGPPGYERWVAIARTGKDPFGEEGAEGWLDPDWDPDHFDLEEARARLSQVDWDAVDDAALAILCLTFDGERAWKGFDWETLDRLHQKGFIGNPKSKAKSVAVTDAGAVRAAAVFERLFVK